MPTMTLGEFRRATAHLGDETKLYVDTGMNGGGEVQFEDVHTSVERWDAHRQAIMIRSTQPDDVDAS